MSYIQGYDPQTLHEIVDPHQCEQRLDEIGGQRSILALMERVWLLKVLDRLDEGLEVAEVAVRQARMAGTRKDVLRARVLHATILQHRGAYPAAVSELTTCAEEAQGQGWPAIAAFATMHRGRAHFDAEDFDAARADFKTTLFLRQQAGAADDQLESVLMAVDAAERARVQAVVAV